MSRLKNNFFLLLCLLLFHAGSSYAERADRNKPMRMEANRVSVDDVNQTSSFEGDVQLTQGTLSIQANKIVVTQDKAGFQHCTATGQLAHFRQKREGASEYVEGYGERIEYDTHSEVSEFFGQARIKREGDDVRGEHITYNTRTEVFQVSGAHEESTNKSGTGRVTLVIQPKSKTPADADPAAASGVTPDAAPSAIKPETTTIEPKQ